MLEGGIQLLVTGRLLNTEQYGSRPCNLNWAPWSLILDDIRHKSQADMAETKWAKKHCTGDPQSHGCLAFMESSVCRLNGLTAAGQRKATSAGRGQMAQGRPIGHWRPPRAEQPSIVHSPGTEYQFPQRFGLDTNVRSCSTRIRTGTHPC
jgi:hypothetical protein